MTTAQSLDYLEAAKIEDLARQLISEGYEVKTEGPTGEGIDLVAKKGDKTIAFQVKARPRLQQLAHLIKASRDTARQRGYDEIRLVVVSPPKDRLIEVQGLTETLTTYLRTQGRASGLGDLLRSNPDIIESRIADLHDVDIAAITLAQDVVHIVGNAVLAVQFDWANAGHAASSTTEFPLHFNVTLGRDMSLRSVNEMQLDTSGFNP